MWFGKVHICAGQIPAQKCPPTNGWEIIGVVGMPLAADHNPGFEHVEDIADASAQQTKKGVGGF